MRGSTNKMNLAGEFYAMHRFYLEEELEPTLTLGNTKAVDILLLNRKNNKLFQVEVKTTGTVLNNKFLQGQAIDWWMDKKHETITNVELIYCFVFLPKDKSQKPGLFLVPSKFVAKHCRDAHLHWWNSEHKKEVKDTDIRSFAIRLDEKHKWEDNFSVFD